MATSICLHDTPSSKDGRWLVTTPGPDEGDPEVLRDIEIIDRVDSYLIIPKGLDEKLRPYHFRIYVIHEEDVEMVLSRVASPEEQARQDQKYEAQRVRAIELRGYAEMTQGLLAAARAARPS